MKNRMVFMIAVACSAGPLGCALAPTDQTIGLAQITGFGGNTKVHGEALHRIVAPREIIETDGVVKFSVDAPATQSGERDADYRMILTPRPGLDGVGKGWFVSSQIEFQLQAGWLFLWGRWPMVKTAWVEAAADGTTFAVQIDDAANRHRVFFLRQTQTPPEKIKVHCRSNNPPTPAELNTPGTYVEVACNPFTGACTFSPATAPYPTIAGSPFEAELAEVERLATAAGWDE